MVSMSSPFLILVVLFQFTELVAAWGIAGHEIVATIAQIHLHPSVSEKLCDILPQYAKCRLAPVAGWADQVRRNHWYKWSSTMHFVGDVLDHPSDHCAFGESKWENPRANVLLSIQNTTRWLQEGQPNPEEALKFLIHFVGDMHQPLHLTGRDRGGNSVNVTFDRRKSNLHSVWDTSFISKSLRTINPIYTRPLPVSRVEDALVGAIYDPYIRQIMWEGVMGRWKDDLEDWLSCPTDVAPSPSWVQKLLSPHLAAPTDDAVVCPFHWGESIHKLNCEIIWPLIDSAAHTPGKDPELDVPGYAGRIKEEWIVEKLLASAGIRLAGILNYLYMDDDEAASGLKFERV